MRGARPIPANLKLLRGDTNKGKNPPPRNKRTEMQPRMLDSVPEPPPSLTGFAAEEWRCVAGELHRLKLLTNVDIPPLAAYCQAYKVWREATDLLTELSASGAFMKGYALETRNGGMVKNPLIAVARDASNEMKRYAVEFGFTPAARTRISTPGEAQTDKFDGLIPSETHGGRKISRAAGDQVHRKIDDTERQGPRQAVQASSLSEEIH
jgi:P27 family predicted phage terminase small subunit